MGIMESICDEHQVLYVNDESLNSTPGILKKKKKKENLYFLN